MSARTRAVRGNLREHGASITVAALSSAFGTALLLVTDVLSSYVANSQLGSSDTVKLVLSVLAFVFIVIAVYVGAIVTANTFGTIVAGRTKTIALMRLIGATGPSLRGSVAREGLLIGLIGSAIGVAIGFAATGAALVILLATGALPPGNYSIADATVAVPAVIVVLTTWWASWLGARRVLTVTPIQATLAAQEPTRGELGARTGRTVAAIVLFALGGGLLLLGFGAGLVSPLGILIALPGGVLSFTGLVLGSHLFIPPVLRLVGRAMGGSAAARLAAANAVRYPERASRTAIGLVIGVTLVTMFAVAAQTFVAILEQAAIQHGATLENLQTLNQIVQVTMGIFGGLTGFSAIIAAVGMINNLSLGMLQRTRELGLLRALGFTAEQVRRMVLAESVQITVASVLLGLILGVFYGWVGAISLLGSVANGALIGPGIPWLVVAGLVASAAVLAAIASIAPTRYATRVSPVRALAVE